MPDLLLKRAAASPGEVVRRHLRGPHRGVGLCCPLTHSSRGLDLTYGYHEDRTPTHGYEPTRAAAMLAFAKSWAQDT